MAKTTSQIESLLNDLRHNYLQELPARLDEIEQNILDIKTGKASADSFKAIYQHVHSLKGSSGTHQLHIKDIPAILMTTKDEVILNRYTDPDYVILKNNQLADNLSLAVEEIVGQLFQQKKELSIHA